MSTDARNPKVRLIGIIEWPDNSPAQPQSPFNGEVAVATKLHVAQLQITNMLNFPPFYMPLSSLPKNIRLGEEFYIYIERPM
jgi:hypothetical protein